MVIEFNIHGKFDFDFSEKRQQELIEDSKEYPGGVASLLLDNLEIAHDSPLTESTFTLDPYVVAKMIETLKEKGAK